MIVLLGELRPEQKKPMSLAKRVGFQIFSKIFGITTLAGLRAAGQDFQELINDGRKGTGRAAGLVTCRLFYSALKNNSD